MKHLSTVLMIAGFCAGTLGAAGFHETPGTLAWALFLGGLVLLLAGGIMARAGRDETRGATGDVVHGARIHYRRLLGEIRDAIVAVDEARPSLSPREVFLRIDELLRGPFFELTRANEDVIALLGFQHYARVWDGVATAERLLNRAWSMLTDGATEEAYEELPRARAHIERAASEMEAI